MEKKKETTTTQAKKEEIKRDRWLVFDAKDKILGRLCAEIAKVLRGKHKVSFTPHVDMGDGVIVINASKVKLTGAKRAQKTYKYYTGFIGGLREIPFENMINKNPGYVIEHAVKGMLPKTRLGKSQIKRLRVFGAEAEGFADAQKPIKLEV